MNRACIGSVDPSREKAGLQKKERCGRILTARQYYHAYGRYVSGTSGRAFVFVGSGDPAAMLDHSA